LEILTSSFKGDFFLISRAIHLEADESWDSWISFRRLNDRVFQMKKFQKGITPDGLSEFSDLVLVEDSWPHGDA